MTTLGRASAAATDHACGSGQCRHAEVGALCPTCPRCGGSGEVGENRPGRARRERDGQWVTRECPACGGAGVAR